MPNTESTPIAITDMAPAIQAFINPIAETAQYWGDLLGPDPDYWAQLQEDAREC